MTREELQQQMKFHLEEYTKLKNELDTINQTDKKSRVRQNQVALLEEFKGRYSVQISSSGEISSMSYDDLESLILSEDNISSVSSTQEGHMLGYAPNGMPVYANQYKNGGVFIVLAVDEQDAKLYLERETRRQQNERKSK